jgi:hypothetical protein
MRMELARTFTLWGSLTLLFLAFAPAFIIAVHAIKDRHCNLQQETLVIGGIIQLYYVRFGIFFGCLGIFARLVRGELAERTLHYWFLAPVRREVLIVGKFLAGTLTTVTVFGADVLTSFCLMYIHFDAGQDFVLNGPGLVHLRAYLLVATLACLGYGAVFLAMSLLFKNPIVPGPALLGGHQRRPPGLAQARERDLLLEAALPGRAPHRRHPGPLHGRRRADPTLARSLGPAALRRPRPRLRLLAHPPPGSALQRRLTPERRRLCCGFVGL